MRLRFLLPLAALLALQSPAIAGDNVNKSATTASSDALSFASLGYESIPLETNGEHTSWRVPVSLNGKPCKLLLDTGADFVILESWVPERLGFATEPSKIQGAGVDGAKKLKVANIPMTIGGKTVEKQHVRARAEGDTAPDASVQVPTVGMLGLSALRDMGVVLDFRRHTLWLPKRADAEIAALMERSHAAKIPLRHTAVTRHFYMEGSVGQEPLRLILDSGAEKTYLSAARAEALKLPLTESNVRVSGADAANRRPKQGMLTDVAFGKASLPQLPVLVLPLEKVLAVISQGEPHPMDGIFGADVLEQGGGILDVANDTLYLGGNVPASAEAATAATGAASATAGHIVMPLERTDGTQFVLAGKINGREARFAVDSGADSIVVHKPLAAELGIPLSKGEGTARGADGKQQGLNTGKIADIELPGGMHIRNQSFPFLDLGHFTEIKIGGKAAKIDALLGHNFIQAIGMIMDVGNNRMLVPAAGAKPGDYSASLVRIGGQPVKLLRGEKGEFYMPVQLDGEEVALLIDTGASVSTLNPDYVAGKEWKRERHEEGSVQTLGQTQAGETATVPNTSFGPVTLPSVPFVVVGHKQETKVEGRRVVGLLGVNVLLPLKIVLDFGTAQALFPPNAPARK